jgi:hypothetical protein
VSSVRFWPHCWSRDHQYRAQNVGSDSSEDAGTYVSVPLPVRIGTFRGNTDAHNGFMLATMIDESAYARSADPLAYSLDKAGVVKSVFKAEGDVGARMHIVDKLSVDFAHIDRRAHEPARDHRLVGCREWDARRHLEVPSLEAVGVITGQAQRSLRSPDPEPEASILSRHTSTDIGCQCGTRPGLPQDADLIGSFTHTQLAGVRQINKGPRAPSST